MTIQFCPLTIFVIHQFRFRRIIHLTTFQIIELERLCIRKNKHWSAFLLTNSGHFKLDWHILSIPPLTTVELSGLWIRGYSKFDQIRPWI